MEDTTSNSSDPLLSSFCPYCNAQPPKYRCPACSARTCSLACSKKHKVYSQCTGIRDPTAFVKRSQLASPTKLSQDYNYLMSIEKAITRGPTLSIDEPELTLEGEAEDSEQEGKIVLGVGQLDEAERAKFAKQIEDSRGVIMKQAPKGMKRARENETALVGGKKRRKTVRWTVEWLLYDQSNNNNTSNTNEPKRILSIRVQENLPLSEAFLTKLHHDSATHPMPTSVTTATPSHTPKPDASNSKSPQKPISTKASRRAFTSTCGFYLKAANAPANKPTLIELAPEKSLAEALRGRVVLEFPTVVVVAKGAEEILERWDVVERSKVEKPDFEGETRKDTSEIKMKPKGENKEESTLQKMEEDNVAAPPGETSDTSGPDRNNAVTNSSPAIKTPTLTTSDNISSSLKSEGPQPQNLDADAQVNRDFQQLPSPSAPIDPSPSADVPLACASVVSE